MDDLERLMNMEPVYASPDELFAHVKYIDALLSANHIKHFVIYGTLLGCVRNKDIIPYDYDFDFGIMLEDKAKILALKLAPDYLIYEPTGTTYSKTSNFRDAETTAKCSLKVYYKNEPVGDLYMYTRTTDGYMQRYDPANKVLFWPMSVFPAVLTDTLDYGFIRDYKVPIPNHAVCLLEYFYGPMWTTPIKAESQNGKAFKDYDFYGSYKYSSLAALKSRVVEEFKKDGIDIELSDKICLTDEDIDYVFPPWQVEWLKDNEGIAFKKYKKQKKKPRKDSKV